MWMIVAAVLAGIQLTLLAHHRLRTFGSHRLVVVGLVRVSLVPQAVALGFLFGQAASCGTDLKHFLANLPCSSA